MLKAVSPVLSAYPGRVICDRVTINAVPGVGLNTTDPHNEDPQIMLRTSKDGGKTWGSQRTMAIGRIGERSVRARTHRLGMSKEDGFVFELSASASVARAITNTSVDFSVSNA